VNVTIQFAASKGYAAYKYKHNPEKKSITMKVTGSGNTIRGHFLLPAGCKSVRSVVSNGIPVKFTMSETGNSDYVDFTLHLPAIHDITINYN
jgi:hypothetical protein